MRINELKTDYAKCKAMTEYIEHIAYNDAVREIEGGYFMEYMEQFKCGLYEDGNICSPDDLYDLKDEIRKCMTEYDDVTMAWCFTAIQNGMEYAKEKQYYIRSVDDLADRLREDEIFFDDDGNLLLVG